MEKTSSTIDRLAAKLKEFKSRIQKNQNAETSGNIYDSTNIKHAVQINRAQLAV